MRDDRSAEEYQAEIDAAADQSYGPDRVDELDLVAPWVADQKRGGSNIGHQFDHELERQQDCKDAVSLGIQQPGQDQAAAEFYDGGHPVGESR